MMSVFLFGDSVGISKIQLLKIIHSDKILIYTTL